MILLLLIFGVDNRQLDDNYYTLKLTTLLAVPSNHIIVANSLIVLYLVLLDDII